MPVTIEAPSGAHFEFGEVKTNRGADSLGEVPLLRWDNLDGAVEHYGEEGILNVMGGTSLQVSFQAIARRGKLAGKSDDDIAKLQAEFKPGKRAVGASTPVSRAKRAAGAAAEKLGEDADVVAEFLAKVASGDVDKDMLAELMG